MKKVLYLSLIGFILVTLFVVIKKDLYIDTYLYKYISMLINKDLTSIIRIITNIGSVVFSIIIIIITSILLYKYNKKDDLKYFLIIMIIGNITSFTLKLIIARNRPDILRLMIENTYSFPSGHTFITTLLYGSILVLLNKYYKKSYVLWTIYGILVMLIMFTRIYLGVHYFSDTLGGFFLGIIFLFIFYKLVGCDKNAKEMVKRRKNI
ncbi:MAG: phosphatase PAP2 family protein [Bacillales bacterium]|nr:phosphatase PAP2 family protein [Bacillales bacterium]